MISFQVSDMTSSHCAGAVKKALKAVDHAALVRVDLANFIVEIEPSSATARQFSDAIKVAGYSPVAALSAPGRAQAPIRKRRAQDRILNAPRPAGFQHGHAGAAHQGLRRLIFAVSRVELDSDGRVAAVLWGRVDTGRNAWATSEHVAPVAAAVAALRAGDQVFALFPSIHGHLPDRQFVVADYDGGRKTIVLDGPVAYGREIHDMDRLDRAAPR